MNDTTYIQDMHIIIYSQFISLPPESVPPLHHRLTLFLFFLVEGEGKEKKREGKPPPNPFPSKKQKLKNKTNFLRLP